jgi:hypothetical protein
VPKVTCHGRRTTQSWEDRQYILGSAA